MFARLGASSSEISDCRAAPVMHLTALQCKQLYQHDFCGAQHNLQKCMLYMHGHPYVQSSRSIVRLCTLVCGMQGRARKDHAAALQ